MFLKNLTAPIRLYTVTPLCPRHVLLYVFFFLLIAATACFPSPHYSCSPKSLGHMWQRSSWKRETVKDDAATVLSWTTETVRLFWLGELAKRWLFTHLFKSVLNGLFKTELWEVPACGTEGSRRIKLSCATAHISGKYPLSVHCVASASSSRVLILCHHHPA